jgi:hypothetical protein
MSVLELLDGALVVKAETLADFQKLLDGSFTKGSHACIKIGYQCGPEFVRLRDLYFNRHADFLVQGEFEPGCDTTLMYYKNPRSELISLRPDSEAVYPVPLTYQTSIRVRGYVVVAVFNRTLVREYEDGCHRIGNWVVTKNIGCVLYEPKHYVLERHMVVRRYSSAPGCGCCTVVPYDVADRMSTLNSIELQYLEEKLLWLGPDAVKKALDTCGWQQARRFMDKSAGPFYHSQPSLKRVEMVNQEVAWRARGAFVRAFSLGTPQLRGLNPAEEDVDVLLGDRRLRNGEGSTKKRLQSFYAGSVLLFL